MKTSGRATGACGVALCAAMGAAVAQEVPAPPPFEAPSAGNSANTQDPKVGWTESLGQPSVYVDHARADVGHGHYKSAARNLREAAKILAARSTDAYGLDRQRLKQDIKALRLTARDVAAGAITSPAQFDSVLNTTHEYLAEGRTAPR